MKKTLSILFFMVMFAHVVSAQSTSASVGLTTNIPLSQKFVNLTSSGYGADAQLVVNLVNSLSATVSTGVVLFSGKDVPLIPTTLISKTDFRVIPLSIGLRYSLPVTNNLTIALDGGLGLVYFRIDTKTPISGVTESIIKESTNQSANAGINFAVDLSDRSKVELGVKANYVNDNYSYMNFRLGYGLNF